MSNPYPQPRSVSGRWPEPPDELEEGLDDDPGDPDDGVRARLRRFSLGVFVRLGWLAVATLVALGSARLAAATEHSPADGSRPELTWAADQRLGTQIDAALQQLMELSDDVSYLREMARSAMSSLTRLDRVGLQAAWNDGSSTLKKIEDEAASIRRELGCRSGADGTDASGMERTYGGSVVGRFVSMCDATDAVTPLREAWTHLVFATNRTLEVNGDLNDHDRAGEEALKLGSQGKYADALTQLALAESAISRARSLRDQVAPMVDVSTLTDWLDRTAGMDTALRLLWQSLVDSKGKVTPQVTAALRAVSSARSLLPTDNRAMSVIIMEMSQVLAQDGIAIEGAQGKLSAAIEDLTGGAVVGG